MPRSISFKICTSLLVLSALTACATTAPSSDTAAELAAELLAKPTPEEIASIQQAEPLVRADFWNNYYNVYPDDRDIALSFIKALMDISSYDRAAEIASFTSITFKDDPEVFTWLGRASAKAGDVRAAIRAYNRVTALSPFDAAPLAALGGIFDREGDHITAQEAYRKALALDPNRAATLSNLALSLTLTEQLDEAETVARRASELPEANATIRQNYALILGLQGKFEEARRIASIDAPEGVAERNTQFLARMIGSNAELQKVAQNAASAPAQTQIEPEATEVETDTLTDAVPIEPVVSTGLAGLGENQTPDTDRTSEKTGSRGLRLKSRSTQ